MDPWTHKQTLGRQRPPDGPAGEQDKDVSTATKTEVAVGPCVGSEGDADQLDRRAGPSGRGRWAFLRLGDRAGDSPHIPQT